MRNPRFFAAIKTHVVYLLGCNAVYWCGKIPRWRQHHPPKRWNPTTSLYGVTTWRQRQHYPPKRWYPATVQHVTPRKTTTWIIMATKSSSLPCFAFIVWFLSFLVIISASCTPILHKNAVNYVISKYNVEPFCNEHFRSLYTPSRTKKHCIRLVMFGLGEITCEEVGLTSHLWYVGESDDTLLITVQHRVHLITARVN